MSARSPCVQLDNVVSCIYKVKQLSEVKQMDKLSQNEMHFLQNLLLEITHDKIQLDKLPTEYNYAELCYKSIAENILDKIL